MKRFKKLLQYSGGTAAIVLVAFLFLGAGNSKTITSRQGSSPEKGPAIAAKNSYVDTVYITVDPTASAAAFALHTKDSTSITNAVLHRLVDGVWCKTVATADTLSGFTSFADTVKTGQNGCSVSSAITLAPLCDQYAVIITFAGSANGVTDTLAYPEYIKVFGK